MRSNDSQKVIVVGIPKSMDDAGLSELFSSFGTVAEAKVVLDAATSASRGFGFVTFTASSAMNAAIKGMNKKKVDGRVLNVRQLVPKDKFQQQKQQDGANDKDPSRRPCWLLRKGKCTKGDSCPFSHEIQDGEFGSCFEFVQTGECKRGDKCKFFHPSKEDADEDADNDAAAGDKKKKKTKSAGKDDKKDATEGEKPKRVCYAYQSGRCHRGKKCLFLHEKLPETKQEQKKEAAPAKKVGSFEVVATDAETGKKRKRDDPQSDSETESEDDDDEEMEEEEEEEEVAPAPKQQQQQPKPQQKQKQLKQQPKQQPKQQSKQQPKQQPKQQSKQQPKQQSKQQPKQEPKQLKAAVVKQNNAGQSAQKAAPLTGLAAHVSGFMAKQQQTQSTSPAKEMPAEKKPQQQKKQHTEGPPTKKFKKERIDMGAAFDGLSDEDEPKRSRKPVDKDALRVAREKVKEDRRAKRSAKKQALSRLKTQEKVDLEA